MTKAVPASPVAKGERSRNGTGGGRGTDSRLTSTNGFAQLAAEHEQHYGTLYRQALRMVHTPESAHDIVQEAFAHTAAAIRDGRQIRQPLAWLRSTVRHLCLQHVKKQQPLSLEAEDPSLLGTEAPEDTLHLRQRCEAIYECVEKLPVGQKSAFIMAEVYGLNYHEIAGNLGRTERAVRQLLVRARARVRAAVGQDTALANTPLAGVFLRDRGGEGRRLNGMSDYVGAKIARLQDALTSLFQRTADVVAQPVAPLIAAAVIVGGLSVTAIEPAGPGFIPSPQPAVAVDAEAAPNGMEPLRFQKGNSNAPSTKTGARPPTATPVPRDAPGDAGKRPPESTKDRTPATSPRDDRPRRETPDAAEGGSATASQGGNGATSPGNTVPPPPPPPPPGGSCGGGDLSGCAGVEEGDGDCPPGALCVPGGDKGPDGEEGDGSTTIIPRGGEIGPGEDELLLEEIGGGKPVHSPSLPR